MDKDSDMLSQETDHQGQILEAFQGVAALLDHDLILAKNPRDSKRHKSQDQSNDGAASKGAQAPTLKLLQIMAQLVLRHERDLNTYHKSDTFMLFCNKEPNGLIQVLLQQTQKWKQQLESKQMPMMALRQHLFQATLTDLLNRLTNLGKCQPGDQARQTLLQKGLLLEDSSLPFLQWDQSKKQLVRHTKTSVSIKTMMDLLTELIEAARDPTLVVRYHSLTQNSASEVIPWRLQISMRHTQT